MFLLIRLIDVYTMLAQDFFFKTKQNKLVSSIDSACPSRDDIHSFRCHHPSE